MVEYKKIYVEWIDSQSGPDGWEPLDDILPLHPGRCFSVGFLLKRSSNYITLCSSINTDRSKEREDLILSRITIPLCSVIKVQVL